MTERADFVSFFPLIRGFVWQDGSDSQGNLRARLGYFSGDSCPTRLMRRRFALFTTLPAERILNSGRAFLHSEKEQIGRAIRNGPIQKPIFPWQSSECLQDGYSVLRTQESKRFIAFLKSADDENWPAPRIEVTSARD